jgi:hypothetical protein
MQILQLVVAACVLDDRAMGRDDGSFLMVLRVCITINSSVICLYYYMCAHSTFCTHTPLPLMLHTFCFDQLSLHMLYINTVPTTITTQACTVIIIIFGFKFLMYTFK